MGGEEGLGYQTNPDIVTVMTKQGNEEISEHDIFQKIAGIPRQAGCNVIRSAITLWVLSGESTVPAWAKVSIVVALGYFLCPIDAIPDFLPGGYIDDLTAMTLLLGQLTAFTDGNIRERVEQLLPNSCK